MFYFAHVGRLVIWIVFCLCKNNVHALSIYPTKIKDVVSKLTQVTQAALKDRNSRMEIELPPTAEFGIESTKSNDLLSMPDKIKKSNREAARLFTDMFSSISSTITVLFPSEGEASTARSLWTGGSKSALFRGKILSIDSPAPKGYSNLRSRKFSFEEQQAALLGSDGVYIPEETEVLIIAGPRTKDYNKIKKITSKLTDATLILLLNSRSGITAEMNDSNNSKNDNIAKSNSTQDDSSGSFYQWVNDNYINVFNYAPPILPQGIDSKSSGVSTAISKREYLLYHEYSNKKWYLACKDDKSSNSNKFIEGLTATLTGGGSQGFKTVWESPEAESSSLCRPLPSQIQAIIDSLPIQS